MSWLSKQLKSVKKHVIPKEIRNVADFELSNLKTMWDKARHNPASLLLGGADPVGNKLWRGLGVNLGSPIVNEFGGPTEDSFARARAQGIDTGLSHSLHQGAKVVAGLYGLNGLSNVAGKALSGAQGLMGGGSGFQTFPLGSAPAASPLSGSGVAAGAAGLGGAGAAGAAAGAAGAAGVANLSPWLNVASTLLGAAGSFFGGKESAKGSEAAVNEQRRQFDLIMGLQKPYQEAGVGALNKLSGAMNGDFSQFQQSPGYQFRVNEGQRGVEQSAAARGGAFSGNALAGINDYRQGQASQEFGNWYNQLSNLAGLGQTSVGQASNAALATGQNVGNALQNGANARASGLMGIGGALQGGLNDYLYGRGRGYYGG